MARNLHSLCTLAAIGVGMFVIFTQHPATGAEPMQEPREFTGHVTIEASLKYLLYLPKGYEGSDESYPLLLFLHGAGESGDDLEKVKIHGPPKLISQGQEFPFIVVSPQSPMFGWQTPVLLALLDDLEKNLRVDKKRVYVTGLSMGGFGTWALAAAAPGRFAAVAPICGGGDFTQAVRLKSVPIWAFHGAKDTVVPLARSEEMVNAVKGQGGSAELTVYDDAAHDSWTETYANEKLYSWLLEHKLP